MSDAPFVGLTALSCPAPWTYRYQARDTRQRIQQDVRVATQYAPPLSSPVGDVAPRAAEPTAAPADGNVTAVSHAQYVPTLTAAAACA